MTTIQLSALVVALPWPAAALSPNGCNKLFKIEHGDTARELAKKYTREQLEQIGRPTKPERMKVVLDIYPPNSFRADWDNIVTRCKPYQDGIFLALGWDDGAIVEARVRKCPPVEGGAVRYWIGEASA